MLKKSILEERVTGVLDGGLEGSLSLSESGGKRADGWRLVHLVSFVLTISASMTRVRLSASM